jgi:hypothetical protein
MYKDQHRTLVLALLIAAHLLIAGLFSAGNPLAEAPDEADHWAYVVYLAREHTLPVGPQVTQSKHPPFYHATAALVADLFAEPSFEFLRANPDMRVPPPPGAPVNFFIHTAQESWPWRDGPLAFHLARLWSVLLSAGTLLATYGIARNAFPDAPGLALTATGVLAFLPGFAFIGSAVSNDGAAAFFGGMSLWGAFRIHRHGRWQAGWWTPIALGLGLLTKVSVVAVWAPVALLLLAVAVRSQGSAWAAGRRFVSMGLGLFGPGLLIAAPWFVRNWRLYGDPLGLDLARQTIDQRLDPWTWADTWWLFKGWFLSFWGRFGAIGQIAQPVWLDWLLLLFSLIAIAGLVRLFVSKEASIRRFPALVLGLAVLSIMAVMWRYSLIALGTDQGRLLYPALGPLILLWVLGLWAWTPPSWRERLGTGLVVATALWCVYTWYGVIVPAYAATPVLAAEIPTGARVEAPTVFDEIELAGVELEPELILYWTTSGSPSQDWRTVLRITAEDGSLVWEWRRSPGEGRWSTDRWSPGVIVRDVYKVGWPDWAGPGRYRVEAAVQAFNGPWAVPVQAGSPIASVEHPFATLGWITRAP